MSSRRGHITHAILTLVAAIFLPSIAIAQIDSPIQFRRPIQGLRIVDTVKIAGSDASSSQFQASELSSFQQFINLPPGQRQTLGNSRAIAVDPTQISLATDYDVRVYFLGEDASYHNTFAFSANDGQTTIEHLIFPDASTNTRRPRRTGNTPLLPGDFVDLGNVSSGTQLDFFLIANGARGGRDIWRSDPTLNVDGLQHASVFAALDSPYLVFGYEDLRGGGDLDFNDVAFAVDVGQANVAAITNNPEPGTWAILASCTMAIAVFQVIGRFKRKRFSVPLTS